ncbi:hypothetical protein [Rhodoferax sp.]|uniref:hypothetical protein n=1 Tax=Rhodoferax sp. TaxID=50421 RepID=UPI00261B42DE|nr:hypothetical protein [Rhodoferax sp.]MDD4944364.1 hypothetical protein [Rhodoferax sp.]MDD5478953.1 hypothetical protein [Rhodoferax sp.]
MELAIDSAFVSAGIAPENAKAAVESINREIDKRFALHSSQLATHGDVEAVLKGVAELKVELIKAIAKSQCWTTTAILPP